ncbi:MAG: UDP-N-acetyl-D-mannosamine dehydrogenase [Kiritimatiellae bacterium]|nr:UDP-N-acetyl-D-mannosamine dehydrogenase [Kiritimatiellia bacterium]
MKICVVGLGYIGLPTAALMAKAGHDVIGVDVNEKAVGTINAGHIHIIENGLEALVKEVVDSGRLRAQTSPCEADAFIIAVPTPVHEDDGHTPGLEYVDAAAQSIAPLVRPGNMVILESTSPVGTTERIADTLAKRGVEADKVFFAHCPERVIPGRALIELVGNDRIVGGMTKEATAAVKALYATFVKGELLETDSRTAEMSKLTENSFRDVNIAFANELSIICDELGIDTMELIRLANHHPRVNILTPGCGVGGHCIAVDPWFIVSRSPERAKLIRCARERNDYKSDWVIGKVRETYRAFGKFRPKIAILGLAFKPDIDDLRASPAVKIAAKLTRESFAEWMVVEPNIKSHPQFALTPYEEAVAKADVIVALVKHSKFRGLAGRNPAARVLNFCDLEVE